MYAYLHGIVADVSVDSCIIEVNNIGYNVKISSKTAEELPAIGLDVRLYTYTSVREDAIQLIGFMSQADLNMFRQLITVSGIGPKGALSILSIMDADAVRFAILTGDVNSLSKAPGVGKRSAERVIIDLKGKIDPNELLAQPKVGSGIDNGSNNAMADGIVKEASEALAALGYGVTEAMKAVRSVDISDDMTVEDVLKLALRELI